MRFTFAAGDTLKFSVSLADYPASEGWVLHYRLTPRVPGAAITFDAAASGDDHEVDTLASVTADWAPGDYTCGAWVTLGAERYSVPSESGQVKITPDPAALTAGTDTRSAAERSLAAVQALLTGKATRGDERYRINGREVQSYPLPDLLRLEQKLKTDVDRERIAAGLEPLYGAGRIRSIFVRVA